jgi:hypothetical protein
MNVISRQGASFPPGERCAGRCEREKPAILAFCRAGSGSSLSWLGPSLRYPLGRRDNEGTERPQALNDRRRNRPAKVPGLDPVGERAPSALAKDGAFHFPARNAG